MHYLLPPLYSPGLAAGVTPLDVANLSYLLCEFKKAQPVAQLKFCICEQCSCHNCSSRDVLSLGLRSFMELSLSQSLKALHSISSLADTILNIVQCYREDNSHTLFRSQQDTSRNS